MNGNQALLLAYSLGKVQSRVNCSTKRKPRIETRMKNKLDLQACTVCNAHHKQLKNGKAEKQTRG